MNDKVERMEALESLYELEQKIQALDVDRPDLSMFIVAYTGASKLVEVVKGLDTLDEALLERSFVARQATRDCWTNAEPHGLVSRAHLDSHLNKVKEINRRIFEIFHELFQLIDSVDTARGGQPDTKAVSCIFVLGEGEKLDGKLDQISSLLCNELAQAIMPLVEIGLFPPPGPELYKEKNDVLIEHYPVLEDILVHWAIDNCNDEDHEILYRFVNAMCLYPMLALNVTSREEYLSFVRGIYKEASALVLKHSRKQAKLLLEVENEYRKVVEYLYKIKSGKRATPVEMNTADRLIEAMQELFIYESNVIFLDLNQQADPENLTAESVATIAAKMELYPDIVLNGLREIIPPPVVNQLSSSKKRSWTGPVAAVVGGLSVVVILGMMSNTNNEFEQPPVAAANSSANEVIQPDIVLSAAAPHAMAVRVSFTGNWYCNTRNPDGTESSDSYRFSEDGSFVSISGAMQVSGSFERSGTDLQLHFKRIQERGNSRTVDARTTAKIVHLNERELQFTSVDATTSAIRRISCIDQQNQ